MRVTHDGLLIQTPDAEELGLVVYHDWGEIERLEAAGQPAELDNHIRAVEELATGIVRRPTAEEIEAIVALRGRLRQAWRPPAPESAAWRRLIW